ncbi:unnamed protein product [Cladocopium goreaui]|uniref:Uncharacterized protein n=1 Tax=Cladocopium goreaui TaxID=2562237 RepID=A0A9P1CP84_9DINO|nr:unnamed protein product [Cladocopium goreaui]
MAYHDKRRAVETLAPGQPLGRHMQPTACDYYSLRSTEAAARERYTWWADEQRPEGIMVRITLTAHGRAELLRDRQLTVGQDSGRLYCRVPMGTTLDANGAEIMMVERI